MSQFTLLQKRAILSVVAAVGVHVAVVGGWILLISWDLPVFAYEEVDQQAEPEPEVVMILHAFVDVPKSAEQPKPKLSPQPKTGKGKKGLKPLSEQKRRFARTSADQGGKPDAPTDVLGERDTRAASDLPPTLGAKPNTPSQSGAAPLYPGHVETVEKKHQEGSVGMDKTGAKTEMPQEATAARKDNPLIDEAPKLESPKPDTASSARPKNKHLQEGRMLPSPEEGRGKRAIDDKPKAEEKPKAKPNKGSKREGKAGQVKQPPMRDGFSPHVRKTRVTGSIARRGKSALNVKNSPLGRYQVKVSKAVELQWRRKCDEQRDHIVPGVVSVRFYVDKRGRISGIKFQERIGASIIMQGFTQRAIRKAKLPKMPRSVMRELDGEPLELIYNFYF